MPALQVSLVTSGAQQMCIRSGEMPRETPKDPRMTLHILMMEGHHEKDSALGGLYVSPQSETQAGPLINCVTAEKCREGTSCGRLVMGSSAEVPL